MPDRSVYIRQLRLIWGAVLFTMISLALFALMIFYGQPDLITPLEDYRVVDQVIMTAVLLMAIAVFLIKRNLFVAEKIVNTLKTKTEDRKKIRTACMMTGRKYQLIIWVLSEAIGLLAFILFVLSGNLELFGIYMLVGIYVLAVNFPTGRFLDRCETLLDT
ncbi:MAG TPA: hypothetical protein ENJ10_13075 [Caldithrix abyssi]|uniref:DUF2975 domain-containing protein n=1 Tax=Caldithrix abyssi TaxID=187145 RepID=A0A7V1LQ36_CALAY|nr:hypothetical protein [Caldithrix abyssi]